MAYKYSSSYNKEHMARIVGNSLSISTKASIEICNNLRNKTVGRAKTILKDAMNLRVPILFTRFTNGAGHKRGIGAGKYPVNAAKEILKIIEAVEANAQFKGLNTSNLQICHISAQNAGNVWRYGRHRRRKMKRTHIEVVVKEGEKKKAAEVKKPVAKTGEKKPEAKVEQKSVEKTETKPEVKAPEKKEVSLDKKPEAPEKKPDAPKPEAPEKKEETKEPAEKKTEAKND